MKERIRTVNGEVAFLLIEGSFKNIVHAHLKDSRNQYHSVKQSSHHCLICQHNTWSVNSQNSFTRKVESGFSYEALRIILDPIRCLKQEVG